MNPDTIEKRLREAADAYYNGTPKLSDADYDELWNLHKTQRDRDPGNPVYRDTILDRVGHATKPDSGFNKMRHTSAMLSLDNVFVTADDGLDELRGWLKGIADTAGGSTSIVVEPKVDGLSLRLSYLNGKLMTAVTRGDGETGDDVTRNMLGDTPIVPAEFPTRNPGLEEFNGEVFMTFSSFKELNRQQEERGEPLYANPRNAAAGILRRYDPANVRGLSFLVHGVVNPIHDRYSEEMKAIHARTGLRPLPSMIITADGQGFPFDSGHNLQGLLAAVGDYPIDGAVFKIDEFAARHILGVTSRAPRWAVALKFAQEVRETTVNSITVQVGRSGVLTPVAELEPVEIDGTVVSRASLHNEDQINRIGVEVGDTVAVRKAGAIIPEIIRSVTFDHMSSEERANRGRFLLNEHIGHQCPSCGDRGLVRRPSQDDDSANVWMCANSTGCPAQLAGRIEYMASRACLDINQMGGEVCDAIAGAIREWNLTRADDSERIRHPFDLLGMPAEWFAGLEWKTPAGGKMTFGAGRAAKVRASLDASGSLPLHRWIAALGIPSIGGNTAREISRLCLDKEDLLTMAATSTGLLKTMADLVVFSEQKKYKQLKEAYGISHHLGPVSITELVKFAASPLGRYAIDLIPSGVRSGNYAPAPTGAPDGVLGGKTFVITGTLSKPREHFEKLVRENGGTIGSGVSGKTDFLLAGEKAGSKLAKAEKLGIPILTEEQFLVKIVEGGADA